MRMRIMCTIVQHCICRCTCVCREGQGRAGKVDGMTTITITNGAIFNAQNMHRNSTDNDRFDGDNRSSKLRNTSRDNNYYGPSQDYRSRNHNTYQQQSHSSRSPQYNNEEEKGRGYSEID